MTSKPIFLYAAALVALLGAAPASADSDRGRGWGHSKHDHREWRDDRHHRHGKWKHHHYRQRERVVVVREVPVYVPPPVYDRPREIVISTPDIVIPF